MLAVLLGLCAASPALADALTPKQAIRVMTQAGYSGIGGVTHDRNFYYAAAIDAKRKRVRVTVDGETGKIVAVVPLRGSGTAGIVTPSQTEQAGVAPITAAPPPRMMFPPYQAPKPPHPIGVIQYPFNSAGQLQPGWCRFQANAPGC
ncbi:hypothetical protein GCM10007874_06290 [Labrys miyagiensis]|uniref:PepSY domain-containing protein n=1 Tax=Labrys miyagiensis TaxID=346912 RepID=A0ABQ6CCT7_9HYPH|nr:hypothetical protein [Labrys miyagiensis]GLS17614.1 hypothetical protein GCM10007874_06290 [Labrys miyagiensis]